jgi:outer membrane protein assembly factor BamB
MAISETYEQTSQKSLRLWPGVVAGVLLLLVRFALPAVYPEGMPFAVMGALLCGLAIIVWWVFFSRAPWLERLGAIVLMIVAIVATRRIVHESIANGMMGMMFFMYAIPATLTLAFVASVVASRRLSAGLRRAVIALAILLGCGVWALVRTNGMAGGGASDLKWRWTKTAEEQLLVKAVDEPAVSPPAPVAVPAAVKPPEEPPVATAANPPAVPPPPASGKATGEWPGFRGPGRDSIARGVRIETDWTKSPPVALWHRPIGPGWSSFAVHGDLLYTQEQRGNEEVVACYNVTTGKPVWKHSDAARFWESNAGPGPRGTPTLDNGRVFAFGATGILNALDAGNGAVVWSHNVASDTGAKVPGWGFSSSPLIVNDTVIVAAAGQLVAYDRTSGNPRWRGPAHGGSYSSPQLLTIDGVPQVVLLSEAGATSVAPADGKVLWEYAWPGGDVIVQPALTADGDVLVNTLAMTGGSGTRRLAVTHGSAGWNVKERWLSSGLKPYFNDFVVHKGHAFGFDGSIISCIDLADGKRKWKGGRYGNGQLVLLPDEDLLLVVSEEGELALVRAATDQFTELARFPAIDGKTWNHPALAGNVLLVRNGQEMAAFRLPVQGR